jgi:hypothetical protein
MNKFRFLSWGLIMVAPIFLSGCLGGIQEYACSFFDDPDHCYQSAAVQGGNLTGCEKIKGEGFEGSNPPKDKCYLQIATNTGDLSACDNIEGGFMSYTKEECLLEASIANELPEGCAKLSGTDKETCVASVGPKITADKVMEVDAQIKLLQEELKNGSDPGLESQLKGLEEKRDSLLGVMTDDNKRSYEFLTDPTNRQISNDYIDGKIDEITKDKLLDLNSKLKDKGVKLTDEQYNSVKDYIKYVNDPTNDIENMDPKDILKDRWNEKLGGAFEKVKFWKANPTEKEKSLDEQLRFYERMLERQAAINAGLSEVEQDFNRDLDIVGWGTAEYAGGKVKDYVLEQALGKGASKAAGITSAVLGEAIDVVKAEAKSAEFRGLVRAYNMGMAEEIGKFGGDVEKAHASVAANLMNDPYSYEDSHTFAQYGNLIENKDCDGSNPHCLNKEVFWKAMKKSYTYQNSK